jgi:hypothetical protein
MKKNSFYNRIKRISSFNPLKTNIQESCKYLRHHFKKTFKLLRFIVSISIFLFLLKVFQDKFFNIFQQIIQYLIENIELTNSKNEKTFIGNFFFGKKIVKIVEDIKIKQKNKDENPQPNETC